MSGPSRLLAPDEFIRLQRIVLDRYGIFVPEERWRTVQNRLSGRVFGLGLETFGQYFDRLEADRADAGESLRMIGLLTNNETYFFRETSQLDALRLHGVPELRARMRREGRRRLRLLSAGCSTGEELYTVAMLFHEQGLFYEEWDVELIGMDVDRNALETARRAVYPARSFRMTDDARRSAYFQREGETYRLNAGIKRRARFLPGNIMDAGCWDALGKVDIILCRNVLIYFTDVTIQRVIDRCHRALSPGGFLCLGHSELLSGFTERFTTLSIDGTVLHRKNG